MLLPDDLITIGIVQKPRGVKGELKVLPTTDSPERFSKLTRVFLTSPEGEKRKVFIEKVRYSQGSILLQLKAFRTPESVDRFRHWEIQIPRAEALPLPEDAYYVFDLVGLEAWTTAGKFLGSVAEVQFITGNNLLQIVSPEGKEYLVPFVWEFVKEVDVKQGKISIEPIEGLLEEL